MRVIWVDGGAESVYRLLAVLEDALGGGEAVLPLHAGDPHARTTREAMQPDEPVDERTAVIVSTSGSTGRPKGVLLSPEALSASALATHARLGGPGRWLLATPAHYIGGLQVLVRSLLAGTDPGVCDLSDGFRTDAFARAAAAVLAADGPHYTALVPTQLARLLDAGGSALDAARTFDSIVVGGAAMPVELRARASDAGVRVVSAYGMSETAGGCVYDGVPLDGVRATLSHNGRVLIAGDVLAHGYRTNSEATAEAFAHGWFHTNDLGRFTDDGALEVLGRADDVINTGGVKIPASTVEDALERHPGVSEACVVGLSDPQWGEAVVAAIVPARSHASPQHDELTALARADAGSPAAPKHVSFVEDLPRKGPGKVDRAAVRSMLSDVPYAHVPKSPVSRLPRGRHQLSREQVEQSQRERLLAAMAEAMSEKGYAATSVEDVLKRARVSRETFYRLFASKQDCFLAAFAMASEWLLEQLAQREPSGGTPVERFETLFSAYLDTLATEPALAKLFLVDVHAAGPEAISKRLAVQQALTDAVAEVLEVRSSSGRFACQMIVSATSAMLTAPLATHDVAAITAVGPRVMAHVRLLAERGVLS